MLTSAELLSIPKDQPEKLFTSDPLEAEKEFKKFKIAWHPDVNHDPEAAEVFKHISELYQSAVTKLKNGVWTAPNLLKLVDKKTGQIYEIKYVKSYPIEVGTMYLSHSLVTFILDTQYEDLFKNAIRTIESLKFESDRMKDEFARYLPQIKIAFETHGACVLCLEKDPELVLLGDVHEYFKHQLDPRHIAWVVSTLYNLNCYLAYSKMTHNDLSLSTYFINPAKHSGALLGGWWFSALESDKLQFIPNRILNNVPPDILSNKKPDHRIDLELVRGIARELICGDWNKIHLVRNDKRTPDALKEWSVSGTAGNPVKEYESWQKVLKDSFGPKKFVTLDVDFNKLYN